MVYKKTHLSYYTMPKLEKPKKKVYFGGPTTKDFTPPGPPPLGLVVIRTFELKYRNIFYRVLFSLVVGPLPPPPRLSGLITKNFFCGFPFHDKNDRHKLNNSYIY